MTASILLLAMTASGLGHHGTYASAQCPSKCLPTPQAPTKVAPACHAPSKCLPTPQCPTKVAPACHAPAKVLPCAQAPAKCAPAPLSIPQAPVKAAPQW